MSNSETLVLLTGAFDPLHSGHLDMFDHAAKLGKVYVGLNSDTWLMNKKRQIFLPFEERFKIIGSLKQVFEVFSFDDSTGTSIEAIKLLRTKNVQNRIIFGNGGIRNKHNTPESFICKEYEIEEFYCLGGNNIKYQSDEFLKKYMFEYNNSQVTRVTL